MTGAVSLVGAGCGGRDLLTLGALRCIRGAQALVYDDLLEDDILDLANPEAELYYVGKRSGRHSASQEEINTLLIRLAGEGKQVCRLKGGDPFVLGRGGEEAAALQRAGIPFRVIPGVSSCIAIPELNGIPVTHRGVSRMFHVVTGHTADSLGGIPSELDKVALTGGTLIVLMGLKNAGKIAFRLMELGRPPDTPAALLNNGTAVRTTLAELGNAAEGFPPPAVMVIGPAAALWLNGAEALPLTGAVVGLTGTPRFREGVGGTLSALGARTCCVQGTLVRRVCRGDELAACFGSGWDWIAFTSPNGVESFFSLWNEAGLDIRRLTGVRFAAVGPGTEGALRARGIMADLVPEVHTTAGLGAELSRICAGKRVLLASAEQAGREPEESLTKAGAHCRRLALYRVEPGAVRDIQTDYLVFGSAGGVRNYLRAGGTLAGPTAVCIGQVTGAAAASVSGARILVAERTTAEGVAEAILRDWSRKKEELDGAS